MTRSDCVAPPETATSPQPGRGLYDAYESWKGWSKPFAYSVEEAEYFAGECRGVDVAGAHVLEIGFGFGAFLAWARDQGARVAGAEINPVSLEAARASGIELLPSDFETVARDHAGRFDTIAAFDVFEHFTIEEAAARLSAVEIMLRPGGRLLLRFPNAQSPFGLAPQFGDPTHKSALSRGVFEQLAAASSLDVERYAPAFRTLGRGLFRRLGRRSRYLARDLVSGLFNAIYGASIPWDPVVALVLRKRERER
jgi:SAM-dependent methyltransferase